MLHIRGATESNAHEVIVIVQTYTNKTSTDRNLGSGRCLGCWTQDSRVVVSIPHRAWFTFEVEAISFTPICLSILSYK